MKPIPTITKNSPLKVEEVHEEYRESKVERHGKIVFMFGIFFALAILIATWIIFVLWVK